jgi:hypothetical protein
MQLVFTIHKKFIKKVPTRPWADRKKSKLFMRPSRNQILFFDLPSGADFVETPPVRQTVFYPYQPIASSIEIATTDFAILSCLAEKKRGKIFETNKLAKQVSIAVYIF